MKPTKHMTKPVLFRRRRWNEFNMLANFLSMICAVSILAECPDSRGDGWQITGTGSYRGWTKPDSETPSIRHDYNFTVTVNLPLWNIHTSELDVSKSQLPDSALRRSVNGSAKVSASFAADFFESGTDGTNIFSVASFQKHSADMRQQGIPTHNDMAASVKVGPFPQDGNLIDTVLWLAFASGDYFKKRPADKIELIFPGGFNSPELLWRRVENVPARWKLLNDPGISFPTNIVALCDGTCLRWKSTEESWAKPPETVRYPKPFDQGYTNWEYRVLSFTNVDGNLWPLTAELRYFATQLATQSSPAKLFPSQLMELQVESVHKTDQAINLPAIEGVALVSEHRFAVESEPVYTFAYFSTNNWRTEQDIRKSPEYRMQKVLQNDAIPAVLAKVKSRMWARSLVIGIFLISPIAIYFLMRPRRVTSGPLTL
jgi:hypothetical protein